MEAFPRQNSGEQNFDDQPLYRDEHTNWVEAVRPYPTSPSTPESVDSQASVAGNEEEIASVREKITENNPDLFSEDNTPTEEIFLDENNGTRVYVESEEPKHKALFDRTPVGSRKVTIAPEGEGEGGFRERSKISDEVDEMREAAGEPKKPTKSNIGDGDWMSDPRLARFMGGKKRVSVPAPLDGKRRNAMRPRSSLQKDLSSQDDTVRLSASKRLKMLENGLSRSLSNRLIDIPYDNISHNIRLIEKQFYETDPSKLASVSEVHDRVYDMLYLAKRAVHDKKFLINSDKKKDELLKAINQYETGAHRLIYEIMTGVEISVDGSIKTEGYSEDEKHWLDVINPNNVAHFRDNISRIWTALPHGSWGQRQPHIAAQNFATGNPRAIEPQAMAAYLGVEVEDWRAQVAGGPEVVPQEVLRVLGHMMRLRHNVLNDLAASVLPLEESLTKERLESLVSEFQSRAINSVEPIISPYELMIKYSQFFDSKYLQHINNTIIEDTEKSDRIYPSALSVTASRVVDEILDAEFSDNPPAGLKNLILAQLGYRG